MIGRVKHYFVPQSPRDKCVLGSSVKSSSVLQPVIEYVKPANQLQLSTEELNEEFARSLNAARPGPARVLVRFNLEEKAFKAEPQLEQITVHYSAEGSLVLKESEEGQRVLRLHAAADEAAEKAQNVNLYFLFLSLLALVFVLQNVLQWDLSDSSTSHRAGLHGGLWQIAPQPASSHLFNSKMHTGPSDSCAKSCKMQLPNH